MSRRKGYVQESCFSICALSLPLGVCRSTFVPQNLKTLYYTLPALDIIHAQI